ncbi:hypothetical protein PF005_g28013, partial [Phytophthora fragariae]
VDRLDNEATHYCYDASCSVRRRVGQGKGGTVGSGHCKVKSRRRHQKLLRTTRYRSSSKCSKTSKPQRTPKKKGIPPKAKGTEAIEWSDVMTEFLMRLRYGTYQKKFGNARNNAMIRAGVAVIGGRAGQEARHTDFARECKNKIKALKKKWVEYCSDRNATGNDVDNPVAKPLCLAMMEEYWTSETGMHGDTLADNDNIGELLESDSDDDSSSSRKKAKTVAEGIRRRCLKDFMWWPQPLRVATSLRKRQYRQLY